MARLAITASWSRALILWLLDLSERRRQRAALMSLDDRLLKDIGLTRADAEREYDKPLWR
ncbi:MAG: DUF1127 domain-containing protein [Rhodospirillales bacterium]|nr:DUF1127 domain-containing protein [Rhodospirillales bacterium]